jgi:metallophosphoesterase (TIGR00282 family)
MPLRILALGDLVGRPGRTVVYQKLPEIIRTKQVDLVVANGENLAGGSGITPNLFSKIRSYGVDVVTLGDHVFKRQDIANTLANSDRLIRPANLSAQAPGKGWTIATSRNGVQVAVMNLLGRIYMNLPCDDPFAAADRIIRELPASVKVIVLDMHAEATSEKVGMCHHLDGRASFVFGTHTHVPTADARILPGGTAAITDVGMCGPYDSILGRRKERVLKYMTTNMPHSFDVATHDVRMCGAIAEIDENTGKAKSIERLEILGGNMDQAYDADDKASTTE